jgi:hypothetical protein
MDPNSLFCENCKQHVLTASEKCPACGFPTAGTENEKEFFYHKLEARRVQLKNLQAKVDSAKVTLWVIAGLNLLYALLSYAFGSSPEDALFTLIINALVSLMFVLIGNWAKEKPFSGLVTGLSIYAALFLYTIMSNEHVYGIVGRIVLIGYLIKGISSAREAEEVKKEIEKQATGSKKT